MLFQTGTAVLAGPLPEPALPRLVEKVWLETWLNVHDLKMCCCKVPVAVSIALFVGVQYGGAAKSLRVHRAADA